MTPRWWPKVWSKADETTYALQGSWVARRGPLGFRRAVRELVRLRMLGATPESPSPLRWGWLLLLGLAYRCRGATSAPTPAPVAIVSTLAYLGCVGLVAYVWGYAGALLCGTAPLALLLGRRALGDTAAALTALACVAWPSPWSVLFALSVKESNIVPVLALALMGHHVAAGTGLALWAGVTLALFGWRGTWFELRTMAAQGRTAYSLAEQRGMPHRVAADVVLLSPAVFALALHFAVLPIFAVIVLIGAALLPLKNARLLLPADLALRSALAGHVPWYALVGLVAVDLWIAWRIRNVYDPTTRNLVGAICR